MKTFKNIPIALIMVCMSCSNYLDINTNPNQPTAVTPNLILPQALAATAATLNGYNTYGSQIGGYAANAGGYGGFNELVSYAYTTNNYASGLWSNSYDNLEDYQYIINSTEGDKANIFFNAVATIMRVYNFQVLVDTFNDIPYTDALKGSNSLTPKYDQAPNVYASLAVELDSAIARIHRGDSFTPKPNPVTNYDIVFKGSMTKWLQLANTIKLRLMVRSNGKVNFANTTFDPAGFLAEDALINPGFTRDVNRQNPAWNTWAYTYTGTAGNKAWVPTTWILSFYDGTHMDDPKRGSALYYQFKAVNTLGTITKGSGYSPGLYNNVPLTGGKGSGALANITIDSDGTVKDVAIVDSNRGSSYNVGDLLSADSTMIGGTGSGFSVPVSSLVPISNQLGMETYEAPKSPTGSRWYPGLERGGTAAGNSTGTLKGPNAGYPLLTAAESYFLQAEAALIGIAGVPPAPSSFTNGITASFKYIYMLPDGITSSGDYATDAANYISKNNGTYLVNFTAAQTPAQQLEAIITQKYIALNFVNSHEGWNDYRRTGYPNVSGTAATSTFASTASISTRPDRLPTRILYPASEAQYNPANAITGISPFTSLIFWAK